MRLATFLLGAHLLLMNLSSGGLMEFARIGLLADHLGQHQAERPDLGMLDLLSMHYLNPEHDSSDPAKLARLPFHHHGPLVILMAEPAVTEAAASVLPSVCRHQAPEQAVCFPRVSERCIDHPPQG